MVTPQGRLTKEAWHAVCSMVAVKYEETQVELPRRALPATEITHLTPLFFTATYLHFMNPECPNDIVITSLVVLGQSFVQYGPISRDR